MKKKNKELVLNGLVAGIVSCCISAMLNYFILPFPKSIINNAISHGIGGFFSGSISAIVGILLYTKQRRSVFHEISRSEAEGKKNGPDQ
jgi:hypothetical protein